VPVVDGAKLVGIVTSRDLRFERKHDDPVRNIMTRQEKLVTVREGASQDDVLLLLHKHRIEKVLVVNDDFQLRGLITVKDIQKARDNPHAAKDQQERCWSVRRSAWVATPSSALPRWSMPASTCSSSIPRTAIRRA
jgi:IMP dehydrogenase